MPDLILATVNARYSHTAIGLRYLFANLGPLASRARILEFHLQQTSSEIVTSLLRENPRVIGLGIYIWNVVILTDVAARLKAENPEIILVLGGPEVSYEIENQPICHIADYIITGEADLAFAEFCTRLLADERPAGKIIAAPPPAAERIALPYHLYTDEDVRHRVIYVEASRGCPFTCAFCLSSLDNYVHRFPLDRLLPAFQDLLDRGVRQFKFLDRTFNISASFSVSILEFFLERYVPGLFLHVEMVPDRLPESLKEILRRFPDGSLQFEIGIQTFNPEVAALIQRRQDHAQTETNIRWLREHTGAHLHADLITGLPGENLASIARGFDRLLALGPHEIQVNPLKRLRGTPILRHAETYRMVFEPAPPYSIISTSLIDAETMVALHRFSRYWNLYGNSGRFLETLPMLWMAELSPFDALWIFFRWLFEQRKTTHHLSLDQLTESLWSYLTDVNRQPPETIAPALARDYVRDAARDLPKFLRPWAPELALRNRAETIARAGLSRQTRHARH